MIEVKEVSSKKDLKKFVKFPFSLYQNNPYWVPPLISGELETLDKEVNPVFEIAEARYFLAYKNNEIVGRIAAIINKNEVDIQQKPKMRFGWFDVIDDINTTKALLDKVVEIGKENQLKFIEGPLGFGNLDKAGMLTEGYDQLATMINIYNHPYYVEHMNQLEFEIANTWVEFKFNYSKNKDERVARFSKAIKEKYQLKVIDLKSKQQLKDYAPQMFELLDKTYNSLDTYVPLTKRQKEYYTKKYFNFINVNYVTCIADKNDKLVAFAITMPSYAKALQKAKGFLFPFGWFHLLKAPKNNPKATFYLIGILPELQGKGVTSIIFEEIGNMFNRLGIKYTETNPELENNKSVQQLWKVYNPVLHKKRSVFKKDI